MLVILDFFVVDVSMFFSWDFVFWTHCGYLEKCTFLTKNPSFFGNFEYRRHTYDFKRGTNDHLLIFTIETKFVCKEFHRCWLFWIFSWSICQFVFSWDFTFWTDFGYLERRTVLTKNPSFFLVIPSTGDTHTI